MRSGEGRLKRVCPDCLQLGAVFDSCLFVCICDDASQGASWVLIQRFIHPSASQPKIEHCETLLDVGNCGIRLASTLELWMPLYKSRPWWSYAAQACDEPIMSRRVVKSPIDRMKCCCYQGACSYSCLLPDGQSLDRRHDGAVWRTAPLFLEDADDRDPSSRTPNERHL
jgi:hypothetical protein